MVTLIFGIHPKFKDLYTSTGSSAFALLFFLEIDDSWQKITTNVCCFYACPHDFLCYIAFIIKSKIPVILKGLEQQACSGWRYSLYLVFGIWCLV